MNTLRKPGKAGLALVLTLLLGLLAGPSAATQETPRQTTVRIASSAAAGAVAYPRYGQRSTAVRRLQNTLIEIGVLEAQLNTGRYDKATRSAVRDLQGRSHMPRTGAVDARTTTALGLALTKARGSKTWFQRTVIGKSSYGRDIVAYRAGEPGKPVVVVVATMHGEENFGQYIAKGLLQGKKITGVDLWVIPVLNPDGLAKDRRWIKGGIDLNRNFPNRWVRRANSGPRASSAKETRVIMTFLDARDPAYLVSWHQPLYGVDTYRVKDKDLMNRLSSGLKLPKKSLDCHGSCHGTMTGWFNATHKGSAITVEYGSKARSIDRMRGRDADAVLAAVGGKRG